MSDDNKPWNSRGDTDDTELRNGHSDAAADAPDRQRPETEESRIGRWTAKMIATIPKPMLGIRGTLYKRLAIKSIRNYYKTVSGADAIAINAKAGQRLDLEPVAYRPPDACEDDESPGWYAKDRDKVWSPSTEGNSVNFLGGKTPTVILEDDDHVEAGFLAPRIGEAIELDQYSPLFVGNDFQVNVDYGSGGNAYADGGNPNRVQFDLETLGQWAGDNVIDLSSGSGHDGMRISTAKAREWRAEKSDSEHMQMQEDRGYLRGLANGDSGPGVLKLLLICGAIILGTLAIVLLGPKLIGGSGGSVSGPLMSTLSLMIGLG